MTEAQLIGLIAAIGAPVLEILYAIGERFEVWDRVTCRVHALEGLRRLKSASGYPVSWIYDDAEDKKVFDALSERISPRVEQGVLRTMLEEGHRPTLITVGGDPIALTGLPVQWRAEEKRVYLSEHPVMFLFGVSRGGEKQTGKAKRACSIGDLERWLDRERTNRQFVVGTVAIVLISIGLGAAAVLASQ